jgi:ubiquinone/menaquinone biosynthesis C-methylase UbiE
MSAYANILDYQLRILKAIFRYYCFSGREILLDIGCGDGGFTLLFSLYANLAVGVDIIAHKRWRKIRAEKIQFIVADARYLPFRNECIDIIFEKDSLHHIENHQKVVNQISQVLRIHGTAILIEANRYNPILYFHMTLMKHHEHFTKKYFENIITSTFSNYLFTSIECHVYPIKNKYILNFIHLLEDLFNRISFFKNYLSYNIAIIQKS